ncbi:MAG: hypothetical protein ACK56C_00115 [Alphaproteobacteria bacterium]|jgi:hypothetical protein
MTISTSVSLGLALAAIGLFAGWRGARPPNPLKGPRMAPWRFIMLLAAAGAMMFLFSALRMAGVNPPGL